MKQYKLPIKTKKIKKWSRDNSSTFIEEHVDLDNRIIHLFVDITSKSVSRVIKGIQLMINRNSEQPINIFINSSGGCIYSSFGLYNFIKAQKDTIIKTYNCGCCMSGGSIIFLAGDEKYMYKDSVFMFHTVSSGGGQDLSTLFGDMIPDTNETTKLYVQMCKIYAENSNIAYKEWYRKLKFQNQYYRVKEALEMEIVDKVL